MNTSIVVAGHLCLDLTPTMPCSAAASLSELLVAGTLVRVGACVISPGGAVANTGLALHRLGVPVTLMGKIGEDALGSLLEHILVRAGCSLALRRAAGEDTSYTIVLAPPGIDRVFLHNPGTNDSFTAADVQDDVIARATLFHFGYPPLMRAMIAGEGAELVCLFRRVKEAGVITSLDMAMPDVHAAEGKCDWERVLARVLPCVDLFLPSVEEVLFFLDRPGYLAKRAAAQQHGGAILDYITPKEYGALGTRLLELGAGVVVLKCGARGTYVRTAESARLASLAPVLGERYREWASHELWLPAFQVAHVASATGAGDCAIAGFLASLLHGSSLIEAVVMANAVGAQSVQTYDATSGVRPYTETRAAVAAWARRSEPLEAPGWCFDADHQVWRGPHDQG
ncbi:MAG: carbohydrate kinase family protein [bacterium]|nr:carbohydrate kinase family protein [bacterium]